MPPLAGLARPAASSPHHCTTSPHLTPLSRPLSHALADTQDTNDLPHRSRRPRRSRCFRPRRLPRVARDMGTACKKAPSKLYNSSSLYRGPSPHRVPWARRGLCSRTRRPQALPFRPQPASAPQLALSQDFFFLPVRILFSIRGDTPSIDSAVSLRTLVPGEGFVEIDGGTAGTRAWSLVMA